MQEMLIFSFVHLDPTIFSQTTDVKQHLNPFSDSSNSISTKAAFSEEVGQPDGEDSDSGETGGCDSVSIASVDDPNIEIELDLITNKQECDTTTPVVDPNLSVSLTSEPIGGLLSESPLSSDLKQSRSPFSSTTWYYDPYLGRPEESSLKDVTFLDSCESAHESVVVSRDASYSSNHSRDLGFQELRMSQTGNTDIDSQHGRNQSGRSISILSRGIGRLV
jgi:hypothetical protein